MPQTKTDDSYKPTTFSKEINGKTVTREVTSAEGEVQARWDGFKPAKTTKSSGTTTKAPSAS